MSKPEFWKNTKGSRRWNDSTAWHGRWQFWRIEIGYHVYRHEYSNTGDRWVFQPYMHYDCKRKTHTKD